MKTIYIIGGTMGVGKTATCKELKSHLNNAVFLDGDWCWDSDPFQVTEETKAMVLSNICFTLNNFIHCSAYENIVFCWVMHEQAIIDAILSKLDTAGCRVVNVSLTVDEENLRSRLSFDVENRIRSEDVIERSIERINMYQVLDTVKVDTNNRTVSEIASEIMKL